MPLPNFIIVGAGKCGTTSLWRYLDQSPDISMSSVKEPGFFSNDAIWARGVEWYSEIFHKDRAEQLTGEASNAYSALQSNPFTLARMKQVLDNNVKFIYCVRNPIKRTESDFMHTANFDGSQEFSEFLKKNKSHRDKNNYMKTLYEYRAAFGMDKICVVFFEDLAANPRNEVAKVCEFLGARQPDKLDNKVHGATSHQVRLPKIVRGIQGSATYAKLSHRIPQNAKDKLQAMIGKKIQSVRPTWSKNDFENFVRQHERQAIEFLKATGKPTDFWSFDQSIVKLRTE